MAVTGLANLAVKVTDLDAACRLLRGVGCRGQRPDVLGRRGTRQTCSSDR